MKLVSILFFLVLSYASIAQQLKPVDEKSKVNFSIKNFGFNTQGSLSGLKGTIKFDPSDIASSSFNVSVDVNTINTGVDARDNHLKKEEYFNAEKFPAINFVSTNITKSENRYTVTGTLTIKGTSKTVSFPFTFQNQDNGVLFSGDFDVNRKDFNVGGGGAVLGNNVNISLKVFAVKS